jgi:DNA-binding response OmpR family regulator
VSGGALRILLVDDDPEARSLARAVLETAGHEVETADHGREGIARSLKRRPDVVVTDVMMPELDGWAFARALRSSAQLSLIPIIFLTALDSPDHALQGFNLGADDFLPKSRALHELPAAIGRVMARHRPIAEFVERRVRPSAAFKGDIEKLGVPAVLFLLESTGKTGTLRLRSPKHGEAVIFVREGSVIGAEMTHSDALRDAHLVYHVATWARGEFEFVDGPTLGDDAVAQSTTELLLEAARRQDEASSAANLD